MSAQDFGKISTALGLFASCIKSGEDWSPDCQRARDDAFEALGKIADRAGELRAALTAISESGGSRDDLKARAREALK